ncbi:dnaJ domain-containing protein [Artemisia annua]|uniref:DnaJ domain-containing protein n=1 Tax=Artemisia annua TaxID=35608 RepID=A0A2U1QB70_ARTAN|nr:dnaJ domain-containing protein [Artemisia annua]
MDDEFVRLTNNLGLKPQGKSAPMKSPSSTTSFHHHNNNNNSSSPFVSDFDYDILFNNNSSPANETRNKTSDKTPVYDKPLYDDDIFASSGRSDEFDHLFGSSGGNVESGGDMDELIPGFGSATPSSRYLKGVFGHGMLHKGYRHTWTNGIQIQGLTRVSADTQVGMVKIQLLTVERYVPVHKQLLCFSSRWNSDPSPTSTGKTKEKSNAVDDPFVVLESMSTPGASSQGLFEDPMEEINKLSNSRSTKAGVSSASGDVFGDIDSLIGLGKPVPTFAKETSSRVKGQSPSEEGSSMGSGRSSVSREPIEESFFGYSDSQSQKMPFDDFQESHQTVRNSHRSFDQATSPTSHTETSSQVGTSPKSEEYVQHADDIWLSVSEIPLFTPITRAPPPSRPPPSIPEHASKSERASFASNFRTFDDDFSSSFNSAKYSQNANASFASTVERANREARERATAEARLKAERAAVQRAQTEARERAAAGAKERAEKVAAEARERASAEKAAAESREKEAREKAAVAKAQAEARRRALSIKRKWSKSQEVKRNVMRQREGSVESGGGGDFDELLPGFGSASPAAPSSRYLKGVFGHVCPTRVTDMLGLMGLTRVSADTQVGMVKIQLLTVERYVPVHKQLLCFSSRWNSDPSPTSTGKTKEKSNAVDDPFVVLESMSTPGASSQGLFEDPMEEINKLSNSRSTKAGVSSASGDVFGDIDSLIGLGKPVPTFAKETSSRVKGQSPSEEGSSMGSGRSSVSREPIEESFFGYSDSQSQKMPFDDFQESHQTVRNSHRSFDQATSPTSHTETSSQVGTSPKSEEYVQHADDIWLSVSEIPLFTPITRAPPPSRPPPSIPEHASKSERASFASNFRTFDDDFSSSFNSAKYSQNANASFASTVERANREARERATAEARLKAERAAVQRAQTEARERAAAGAKERAEKVAAEARERASAEKAAAESREKEAREKAAVAKAQAEARRRAERTAVERVTAEARERAAAEAREKAAAAAKMNQQKNDNDLDSFFPVGSPPNSAPKARATANDSATDPLSQVRRGPEGAQRSSSKTGAPPNVRKPSPTTNFVDDLNSIFEAATPAAEFQDVEGESKERRRARFERQQRTDERAAKALAEKNQRDLQNQKEQEERQGQLCRPPIILNMISHHLNWRWMGTNLSSSLRVSVTLDVEIKRWAAGKEGNLRSMLSSLQYVLWPECGWQPISLVDLITGASVKKAYRKATLCIHPDKVQQKGATIQQKYVAEKVFDLLKIQIGFSSRYKYIFSRITSHGKTKKCKTSSCELSVNRGSIRVIPVFHISSYPKGDVISHHSRSSIRFLSQDSSVLPT